MCDQVETSTTSATSTLGTTQTLACLSDDGRDAFGAN